MKERAIKNIDRYLQGYMSLWEYKLLMNEAIYLRLEYYDTVRSCAEVPSCEE